jgi:lysophospholipase L1-like esterase
MKEITIVALGDSITNGAGIGDVNEEDTFRHHIQDDLSKITDHKFQTNVINAGVNGDITTTAILRLERDVFSHKPDYVTVMFGVNDAGFYRPATDSMANTPRVSENDFRANLETIITQIQKAGATPILITPLPMNEFYAHKDFPSYLENGLNYLVERYSDVIRNLCAEKSIYLIDMNGVFIEDTDTVNLIPDGIHPNKCGHRFIADVILSELVKIL